MLLDDSTLTSPGVTSAHEQRFVDLFNGDLHLHARFDADGVLDFDRKVIDLTHIA